MSLGDGLALGAASARARSAFDPSIAIYTVSVSTSFIYVEVLFAHL
jgi:hypothetical protein